MVLFFTSKVTIYMGRDKVENEDLLKYGLPTDVWFHVDKLSSAHVYLRQPDEQPHGDWEHLPAALVNDAAQLVKANSIEGESQLQAKLGEFLALERVTGHRFTISHAVPSSQSEGRAF
ncbi:cytoplasm protein [Trichosporon asahii var. asahii CBS 2479]|uniref:Cytoplasm protein n=1 Tax=Trichosporon asahii var. asahii (strain ATCC 90039 / CBS 2479 / JCM 2466 / KCTC 7840 / NBRC 103889/ NCYC 2677 / UAMH 7654) TaxID=1186058 RepID=J5SUD7_TRIAS|nr:cytoplasm protein [Trichosporon asahii var. asahii CBS 2479]EJT47571.1 cytoplasm protein [Trichosporon asahii var. asahii CBS 2479]